MVEQVAGSSRIGSSFDSTRLDRQRQIASKQKAGRLLGAHAPAAFLAIDTSNRGAAAKCPGNQEVVLNSPVSKCPTSFLPLSSRFPTITNMYASSSSKAGTEVSQPSATNIHASVPPLNFKRQPHRKSFSMARIETEMTDYKRDAAQNFDEREANSSRPHAASYWSETGELCIVRRQSLPEPSTMLKSTEGSLRRHPRPLPPVPLSRPVSPASSISSSQNSHSCPRPLPVPPTQTLVPSSCISSPSESTEARSSLACSAIDTTIPPEETELSPAPSKSRPESDLFSPLSPLSIITDLPHTLRVPTAPSPRSSEARRRHRVHASPYKLSRNPIRYSTTSLSSQVSVPPVPPPAELRRRNREKMAKLIRMLGDSPPSDLVFASERDPARDSSDDTITEESFKSVPPVPPITLAPLSLEEEESISCLFGKKNSLSDPDVGHGERARSPFSPPCSPRSLPSAFPRRLQSKRGRAEIDKAPRYVVSLFDTDESKRSERFTFKLSAKEPKVRPTASYLRSAYKADVKPKEVKLPSVPSKIPGIDLPKQTRRWVRESGPNRWEVDNYENVVKSLRKL